MKHLLFLPAIGANVAVGNGAVAFVLACFYLGLQIGEAILDRRYHDVD